MDLAARKFRFIKEVIEVENEAIMEILERVLKHEQEAQELDPFNKEELDKRVASYRNNPENLLDWEEVKKDW